MQDNHYDVVIAGAGPAGSSLAIRLGRAGYRVALLDRAAFPRRKPCGEFMSPEVLPMLDDLGVREEVVDKGAFEVRGMILKGAGHECRGRFGPVGSVIPRYEHGYGIRREVFDDILMRKAKALDLVDVFEAFSVRDVLRADDGTVTGIKGRHRDGEPGVFRGSFSIGADGRKSSIASALGVLRPVPNLKKFALTTRYENVKAKACGEVHIFDGGYFAACPVDRGLFSVNLVIDAKDLKENFPGQEKFFADCLAKVPEFHDKLLQAQRMEALKGIGPLATRTTQQVFDGAALVGDACGYVDPITGEGIFLALRGAEMLTRALETALATGKTSMGALRIYAKQRRKEFRAVMMLSRMIQAGLQYPRVVKAILKILERRGGLMDLLVSVTGDYVHPRALLRPSVLLSALSC